MNFLIGQTSHNWTELFVNDDLEEFNRENQGGKHCVYFYGYFPEIETEAKLITLDRLLQKNADFTEVPFCYIY
jgi:hypothetical protein